MHYPFASRKIDETHYSIMQWNELAKKWVQLYTKPTQKEARDEVRLLARVYFTHRDKVLIETKKNVFERAY